MQKCKCGVVACKSAKVRDIPKGPNQNLVLNTRTRDLRMDQQQLCRDAVPTLPKDGADGVRHVQHSERSQTPLRLIKPQLERIKVISVDCLWERERAQFIHPAPP